MKYEDLLIKSTQIRCSYLVDVLNAVVAEARESHLPQGVAVEQTLAAFSLSDVERRSLQREAIERLRTV